MVQTIGQILKQQGNRGQKTQQTSSLALQQKTMLVSKYGNREAFLTEFNPSYQMKVCDNTKECFFGDYPTLAEVKVNYGDNAPKMWLIPQLYNLSEYCGVKEKLQGTPLEETAFVIASTYYYFKVTELMLFFHRFKSGRYGRFYGNVDPLVITTALRDFAQERINAIVAKESEDRDREREEQRKNCVTWEEYCMKRYGQIKKHPFEEFASSKEDKDINNQ